MTMATILVIVQCSFSQCRKATILATVPGSAFRAASSSHQGFIVVVVIVVVVIVVVGTG